MALLIESIFQDIRFAFRSFARYPAVTAVAVIAIALGIGANTAIFSVVNAVLLRPLPYKASDRLVWIWSIDDRAPVKQRVSYPDFLDWREQSRTVEDFIGWNEYAPVLTGVGDPQTLRGVLTLGPLFSVLGVEPALGSVAEAEKSRPDGLNVILSHDLWRRTFESNPDVIGRRIRLDGTDCTVTAVMPSGFRFPIQSPDATDVWVTVQRFNPALASRRDARLIEVMGRLKPDATMAQAQAEMDRIASTLSSEYPGTNGGVHVRIVPALTEATREISLVLFAVFGAGLCVFCIACANVANFQMARAVGRRRELTVRAAIGGGRWRIARQLGVEGLLLGLVGGAVGGLASFWALNSIKQLLPAALPRAAEIGMDLRVLAFTAMTSLLTGLVFGIAPSFYAWRINLSAPLTEIQPSSGLQSGQSLRRLLIAGEIALAMILLAGAGLFLKTLWRLNQIDPGFDPGNVLIFEVHLPSSNPRPGQSFEEIVTRLRAVPGVRSASLGLQIPDRGGPIVSDTAPMFDVEGSTPSGSVRPRASILRIQTQFFRTLGIPLLEGRDFGQMDRPFAPQAAIINQALARRYFSVENPVGRRISLDSWLLPGRTTLEVIGVAGDVKYSGAAAQPVIYVSMAQFPRWSATMVLKTAVDPFLIVPAVRDAIRSFDKDQPIDNIQTLDQRMTELLGNERFNAVLLSLFSIVALMLAALGVYGAISYSVAQRTREMGIRIALGAERGQVLRLVLHEVLRLTAVGVALGFAGALAVTRFIRELLFGVSPTDASTFAAAALVLFIVAGLAAWIPALRATTVNPVAALRHD